MCEIIELACGVTSVDIKQLEQSLAPHFTAMHRLSEELDLPEDACQATSHLIRLDTKRGPLVVEIPPEVLGAVNDFRYRWVADVGITGEDRGKGGKYLFLPPGYKGEIPAGYVVVRPSTYGNWLFFRAFLVDGSTKPGVESVKKRLKIYQLSEVANPPAIKFVNASGVRANFVAPSDYAFWELLNKVIQEEPSEGSDPTTLGLC